MSTNFFIQTIHGPGIAPTTEHIGKRSAGWYFTFQGSNFRNLQAWYMRLLCLGTREEIVDEYGRVYSWEEFVDEGLDVNGTQERKMSRIDAYDDQVGRSWRDLNFKFNNYEFS